MRTILLLFCVAAMALVAKGQGLRMIAHNTADSVVLRWAPVSAANWERYNRFGFRVERVTVPLDSKPVTERLSQDTLRPWTLEQFEAYFTKDNPYAGPVVQALYGKNFASVPSASDPGSFMDQANEQAMRWSMAMLFADYDAGMAEALGLRWVDHHVQADARYLYRVITLDPQSPDTAVVGVNRQLGPQQVPSGPRLSAEEGERKIALQWMKADQIEPFSGYWIERSSNGHDWARLNKAPFLQADPDPKRPTATITYTDTTIAGNYIKYHYRVQGITAFGETSTTAPEVIAMGRDRTAPPSPAMRGVTDENGKLVVHWEQPAGANDLKGFRVEKAPTADGPFHALHTALVSPSVKQFTDTSTFLIDENHYRVAAVDTAGNTSYSLEGYGSVADSIPPAVPSGLQGSIDTNGVVTLHWPIGREPDLLGYRVFFANAADHVFNNLSPVPLQDTVFHDTITLKTLTKNIYYRLVAVDRSFNHSGMSGTLVLKRPDIVKPVAPVFSNYQVTDTTVVLHFIPSPSTDVAMYKLFRTEEGGPAVLLTSWRSNTVRSYVDTAITGDAFHRYTLQAIDSTGNASAECIPLNVHTHTRLKRDRVEAPTANMKAGTHGIAVTWHGMAHPVTRYVIYRSKNDAQWFSIGSVNGNATLSFTDDRMTGAGSYRYSVGAVYPDGMEAPLGASSAPVNVQ